MPTKKFLQHCSNNGERTNYDLVVSGSRPMPNNVDDSSTTSRNADEIAPINSVTSDLLPLSVLLRMKEKIPIEGVARQHAATEIGMKMVHDGISILSTIYFHAPWQSNWQRSNEARTGQWTSHSRGGQSTIPTMERTSDRWIKSGVRFWIWSHGQGVQVWNRNSLSMRGERGGRGDDSHMRAKPTTLIAVGAWHQKLWHGTQKRAEQYVRMESQHTAGACSESPELRYNCLNWTDCGVRLLTVARVITVN